MSNWEGGFVNEQRVRVGLVGFGTVGTGVAKLILEDGDAIASKMGVRLELACVVDVFGGDAYGYFGRYGASDRVWAEYRYSF